MLFHFSNLPICQAFQTSLNVKSGIIRGLCLTHSIHNLRRLVEDLERAFAGITAGTYETATPGLNPINESAKYNPRAIT